MDPTFLLLFPLLLSCICIFISIIGSHSPKSSKLPPGPLPIPVIGNILQLGSNPHKALTKLSKIYGPIMALKLGSIITIVISSPELAKEALHKNDLALSSRTILDVIRAFDHDKISVVWLPTSSKWKNLRKICATKLFSPQQLDSTQMLRQKKLQELVEYVQQNCNKGEAIDIGEAAFTTVLNSISNAFFSMDLAHYTSDKSKEFKETIRGIMENAGKPNIVDFFPILRPFDPHGGRATMSTYFGKLLKFFDGLLEERLCLGASELDYKDLLNSFLSLIKEDQLSRQEVLHLLLDLFVAGIDTTSTTVEWAMAELLNNPPKLLKVKQELQNVLGRDELFEESHILKLPFLRAVLKETLRLHPPIPFLVPHKSEGDVELGGYRVPKNAQILVNVWAMGRDTNIWSDADLFVPERFLESEIDFKGRDFELIPFGAGRRICPGLPLANRLMPLMLASLLHNHDWKLPGEFTPKVMNMMDSYGLTLKRAQPLLAIPTKGPDYNVISRQM